MATKDWCLLPQTTYPKYWRPIDEIVGELDYDEWHEFEGGNDYNSKLKSDLEEKEKKKGTINDKENYLTLGIASMPKGFLIKHDFGDLLKVDMERKKWN